MGKPFTSFLQGSAGYIPAARADARAAVLKTRAEDGMGGLIMFLAATATTGYGSGMPGIMGPCLLDPGISEIQIRHRFLGEAFDEPLDDFLGTDQGANIRICSRSFMAQGVELDLSHESVHGEYMVGAGYNACTAGMPASLHVSGHWYWVESEGGGREDGFLGLASAESPRLGGVVSAVLCGGYDAREGRTILGFGADAALTAAVGMQAEYWPARDGSDGFGADSLDVWCLGLRMDTAGHRFGLFAGNCTAAGPRLLSAGTPFDEPRLGIYIARSLSL